MSGIVELAFTLEALTGPQVGSVSKNGKKPGSCLPGPAPSFPPRCLPCTPKPPLCTPGEPYPGHLPAESELRQVGRLLSAPASPLPSAAARGSSPGVREFPGI